MTFSGGPELPAGGSRRVPREVWELLSGFPVLVNILAVAGWPCLVRRAKRIHMLPTWEFVSARYLHGGIYLNYTTEFYCTVMLAFFPNLFFFFQLYYGILWGLLHLYLWVRLILSLCFLSKLIWDWQGLYYASHPVGTTLMLPFYGQG